MRRTTAKKHGVDVSSAQIELPTFALARTILLVIGGRDYVERNIIFWALDLFVADNQRVDTLVHGACTSGRDPRAVALCGYTGADGWAHDWAVERGVDVVPVPAQWSKYGRRAGSRRNQEMLDVHAPSHLVAFPGGPGTADMLGRAERVLPRIQIARVAERTVGDPVQ